MGNPLLEKQANPAATAVNNAGNGHGSVPGDDPELEQLVTAREVMHDDSGAQTGLRRRPDYGESDSFTSTMNRENSKYAVCLEGDGKTAALTAPMYVAGVQWEGLKVAEARLTAKKEAAANLPWYTAVRIARELPKLNSGLRSRIVLI